MRKRKVKNIRKQIDIYHCKKAAPAFAKMVRAALDMANATAALITISENMRAALQGLPRVPSFPPGGRLVTLPENWREEEAKFEEAQNAAFERYLDEIQEIAKTEYGFPEFAALSYRNCGGWKDYYDNGYPADIAVWEDMQYSAAD